MDISPKRPRAPKKNKARKVRAMMDTQSFAYMHNNPDQAVLQFRNEFLRRLKHFKGFLDKVNTLRPRMIKLKRKLSFVDIRVRTMWETLRISHYLINHFHKITADFHIIYNLAVERVNKHPRFFRKFHMDRQKYWRSKMEHLDWYLKHVNMARKAAVKMDRSTFARLRSNKSGDKPRGARRRAKSLTLKGKLNGDRVELLFRSVGRCTRSMREVVKDQEVISNRSQPKKTTSMDRKAARGTVPSTGRSDGVKNVQGSSSRIPSRNPIVISQSSSNEDEGSTAMIPPKNPIMVPMSSSDESDESDPLVAVINKGYNPTFVTPQQLNVGVPSYNAAMFRGEFNRIEGIRAIHHPRSGDSWLFARVSWPPSLTKDPPVKGTNDVRPGTTISGYQFIREVADGSSRYARSRRKDKWTVDYTVNDGQKRWREDDTLKSFALGYPTNALQVMFSQFSPTVDNEPSEPRSANLWCTRGFDAEEDDRTTSESDSQDSP